MNLTCVLVTRRLSSGAPLNPLPKEIALRLKVAILSTYFKDFFQNDRLHEYFTFCINLLGINDCTPTYP